MGLPAVFDYLVTNLQGLAITEPRAMSVQKVWKYTLPARLVVTDTPCITLSAELQQMGYGVSLRQRPYDLHIQLFVGPSMSEADIKLDAGWAFVEALVEFFGSHITLGGVGHVRTVRGGAPDTVGLAVSGEGYVVVDFFVEITLTTAAVNAA